ncbi:MAG: hypothetical protein M5U30_19015 [Burkholderiaceae bacterium]|nr:hypothetical protein [Burkholderiaceae bacterium]
MPVEHHAPLPQFIAAKYVLDAASKRRAMPNHVALGRLDLMTSAPASASARVHIGPDITIVKSTTRTPSNASVLFDMCSFSMTFPDRLPGQSSARCAIRLRWISLRRCRSPTSANGATAERPPRIGAPSAFADNVASIPSM